MRKKQVKPGDWHYRWWCRCGYNYEALYTLKSLQPMCPECGRPPERLEMFKGRWKSKGKPGPRQDFEVWTDPDPLEKRGSMNFFERLVQRFKKTELKESTGPIRKDVMASPVFVEPEEEEEPEKKAITRRRKRKKKKAVKKKRKKSTNGRRKKAKKK